MKPFRHPLLLATSFLASHPGGVSAQNTYHQGNPTNHEQLMLELVNRARANPAAEAARLGIGLNDGLSPGTITTAPKQPLAFHPALIDSSRSHSDWMLATNTFSHTGAGGSSPQARMVAAGYAFTGSWGNGENIASGGTSGPLNITQETVDNHEALFRSASHRTNICSPLYRDIGVGIRSGTFDGLNAAMVTQNFALSGSQPHILVTGVVFRDLDGNGFYSVGEGLAGVTVFPEGGNWQAVTSASGGYAVPYTGTSGNLTVRFSDGPLGWTVRKQIVRTGSNVKVDLMPGPYVEIVPGSLSYSAATGFRLVVRGTQGLAFNLQYSQTLSATGWADVDSRVMGASNITLTHNAGQPKGFYRLTW